MEKSGETELLMEHVFTPTEGTWINESCNVDFAELQKRQEAMKKAHKWGMLCGMGMMLGAQAEEEFARQ